MKLQVTQFKTYVIKKKKNLNTIFVGHIPFFFVGMKALWDEGGWRILLGDTTGGEVVKLWPTRFLCVGIWI